MRLARDILSPFNPFQAQQINLQSIPDHLHTVALIIIIRDDLSDPTPIKRYHDGQVRHNF